MTNRNLNRMKSKGTNKKVEVNDGKRKQRKIEYDTADGRADCLPFHRMYRKSKCHFREKR